MSYIGVMVMTGFGKKKCKKLTTKPLDLKMKNLFHDKHTIDISNEYHNTLLLHVSSWNHASIMF